MKLITINYKVYRVKNEVVEELNRLSLDRSNESYWKAHEIVRKIEKEKKYILWLDEQYNF